MSSLWPSRYGERVKMRAWLAVGALIAMGAIAWAIVRARGGSDAAGSAAPAEAAAPAKQTLPTPEPTLSAAAPPPFPVDLDDLRAKLPTNRYWELVAPTSDPEIAKTRAERAKRDNALFGRTQTGEAAEDEIRAYYAEQRRISEDYLQLSLTVLAEKAEQLSERDRGLFELSVQLHRARLTQIERDLSDALTRRRDKERRE
jgi:hypothetical protein